MKTDDWALLWFAVAIVLFGVMTLIAAWVFTAPREAKRSKPKPVAHTAVFSRTQLQDLLHQVDAETVILRQDDAEQTLLLRREIPPPVRRARRRTW